MKTFKITLNDDTELQLEADYFVMDGSGLKLFDALGTMIAAWADGQVKSIYPISPAP